MLWKTWTERKKAVNQDSYIQPYHPSKVREKLRPSQINNRCGSLLPTGLPARMWVQGSPALKWRGTRMVAQSHRKKWRCL
jgi:hypothetical protein